MCIGAKSDGENRPCRIPVVHRMVSATFAPETRNEVTMEISVWFGDTRHPSLASFVEAKANTAFSRFEQRLLGGELRLSHEHSSTRRIARCSLDLKTVANGTIHIDESDDSDFVAISNAIRAAQAKLLNASRRRKSRGRQRGRAAKRILHLSTELQDETETMHGTGLHVEESRQ